MLPVNLRPTALSPGYTWGVFGVTLKLSTPLQIPLR